MFDGYIPGSEIHWSSDRDGPIGTGNVLTITHLSPGQHTILAEVTDWSAAILSRTPSGLTS